MHCFLEDQRGIEGLPMKLIIIVVIAGAVLAAVLMMIPEGTGTLNAECISVDGNSGHLKTVSAASGEISVGSFDVTVQVTDGDGDPVADADVTLIGANGAGAGKTGGDGEVTVTVQNARLDTNEEKDYVSVEVTASGHHSYEEEQFVVIARTG